MDEINGKIATLSKAYNLALITMGPIVAMLLSEGIRSKINTIPNIEIQRQYIGFAIVLLLPIFSIHISFLWESLYRSIVNHKESLKFVEEHAWWMNPFKFISDGPNMYGQTAIYTLFFVMFCSVFIAGRLSGSTETGIDLGYLPFISGGLCGLFHARSTLAIFKLARIVAPNQRTTSMIMSAMILAGITAFYIAYSSGLNHNKLIQPTAVSGG